MYCTCKLFVLHNGGSKFAWWCALEMKWWNRDIASSSVCEFGDCVHFLSIVILKVNSLFDRGVYVIHRFLKTSVRHMKKVNFEWCFFTWKNSSNKLILWWLKLNYLMREKFERVKNPGNGVRGEKKVCERLKTEQRFVGGAWLCFTLWGVHVLMSAECIWGLWAHEPVIKTKMAPPFIFWSMSLRGLCLYDSLWILIRKWKKN